MTNFASYAASCLSSVLCLCACGLNTLGVSDGISDPTSGTIPTTGQMPAPTTTSGATSNPTQQTSGSMTTSDDALCGDTIAAGWDGPFAVYQGSSPPPDCPPGAAELVLDAGIDPGSEPFACSPCTCGDAALGCKDLTVNMFGTTDCSDAICHTIQLSKGECHHMGQGNCVKVRGFAALPPASTGTCASAGGAPELTEVTWTTYLRACAPQDGSLGFGDCSPAALGVDYVPCITSPGVVDCPPGPFSLRTIHYAGLDDARDCTPCTCQPPPCKFGYSVIYNDAAGVCSGNAYAGLTGACLNAGEMITNSGLSLSCNLIPPDSCEPAGGEPMGELTQKDPITACCAG